MPNVVQILKQEISRIARKEVKGIVKGIVPEILSLRKSNSNYKKRIAQLESKVGKLEKQLGSKEGIKLPKPEEVEHSRLGASNIVKLRKKLGITRAEMAKLIGASTNSIFLWENGKANPRAAAKAKIIALRTLGRRELKKLLGEDAASPAEKSAPKAKVSKRKKAIKATKAAKPTKNAVKPKTARKAKPVKVAASDAVAPAGADSASAAPEAGVGEVK